MKSCSAAAALLSALLALACSMEEKKSYIGPSDHQFERFTPEALLSLGRIKDPMMCPDGKTVLFSCAWISVEENRSVSNFWIADAEAGAFCRPLTREGNSVSNAEFRQGSLLFLQNGKLYSAAVKGSGASMSLVRKRLICKEISLPDGSTTSISAFKLSPDGNALLLQGEVKGPVDRPTDRYAELDKADAYLADDLMYRHWDHWCTKIPHTFVASFDGKSVGEPVDILGPEGASFELPLEPFGGLEQLSWSPDGRFIAYSAKRLRGKDYAYSTDSNIYIYDRESGETTTVTEGGGYDTDPLWSPDGQYLAWISMERNGYEADRQRILLRKIVLQAAIAEGSQALAGCAGDAAQTASASDAGLSFDGPAVELTRGFDRDASSLRWTADSRQIRFRALTDGLGPIYSVDLQGNICRLTAPEDPYAYSTPFYEAEGYAWLLRQSMLRPVEVAVLRLSDASVSPVTNINGRVFDGLEEPEVEARWIDTVDGKKMLTWVLYPPQFTPSKQYPAILITLGGPQGSISQDWSYRWCYRLMAEQGYIVVLPNRRGTTAFGQAWKEQISGDYTGLNMQDYLSAARALKAEPYVGKMAAFGASYGGYSVYYLCGIHGDVFDCFIAHAGIFNEEHMYHTTEEMWFPEWDNCGGYPSQDAEQGGGAHGVSAAAGTQVGLALDASRWRVDGPGEGSPWSKHPKALNHYAKSPHKLVQNWHTPLMVIHGGRDYRVPYDQGLAAFGCARMMGVPARLLVFPEENHWILAPQNALLWHREFFKWLDTYCR